MNLSCNDYSDKAVVVRGDTKEHKEQLKSLGGKYNANLRDGPGWIFSKKAEKTVREFIQNGTVPESRKTEEKSNTPFTTPENKGFLNTATSYYQLLDVVRKGTASMSLSERLRFIHDVSAFLTVSPAKSAERHKTVPVLTVTIPSSEPDEENEEEQTTSDDEEESGKEKRQPTRRRLLLK